VDFKEIRKACLNCDIDEIIELATAPEKFEHRENYSMGAGYFLGAHRYSGWKVKKAPLNNIVNFYNIAGQPQGFYAFNKSKKNKLSSVAKPQGEITSDIKIISYSERAFVLVGNTKPVKDIISSLGGKPNWNLKDPNGNKYFGWIFPVTKLDLVKKELALSEA
jgi:hypothetical protein